MRRVEAFLDAQAAEAGAARNTLLAYGRDLADLAAWTARHGLTLAAITRDDIESYLSACEAEGLSRATRARRLSAIRQFTRFSLDEGWRDDDPAIRLTGPGRSPRLPRTLTQGQVETLLAAVPAGPPVPELPLAASDAKSVGGGPAPTPSAPTTSATAAATAAAALGNADGSAGRPVAPHVLAVEDAADGAREIAARYFRQPLGIEHKGDDSPVTIAEPRYPPP